MTRQYISLSNKAYLQIDFAFAVLVFILVFFIFFSDFSNFSKSQNLEIEVIKHQALANDICYLLTSTKGFPNNWNLNPTTASFYGLLNSTINKTIDPIKTNIYFQEDNYFLIQEKLQTSYLFSINLINISDSSIIYSLGSSSNFPNIIQSSSCYSNYLGSTVLIFVEVWS